MYQAIIASYKLFIILRYVINSNTNKGKMLTRQKHHCEYRDSFLNPCRKESLRPACHIFTTYIFCFFVFESVSTFLSQQDHPSPFFFT